MDFKNKKKFLIYGGIILGSALLFYFLSKKKIPQNNGNSENEANENEIVKPPTPVLDLNLVLKQGIEGAEVMELQRILKKDFNGDLGNFGVNADGIDGVFGDVTLKALLKAKGVTEIKLKDLKK